MAVLLAVAVVAPSVLPYQRTDESKADLRDSGHAWDWSAVFRVDAVAAVPNALTLIHDGLLGSAIYRFDGNPRSLTRFDTDPRSFPFEATGKAPGNVLIIGAAGGNEVLASLYFDADPDRVDRQFARHGFVHSVHFRPGDQAISHVRLVRDYRQEEARSL